MPFVTEELWQRLPRRGEDVKTLSIVVAAYPEEDKVRDKRKADTNMNEM